MANLTGRGIYQKTGKAAKKRKRLNPISAKKSAYRRSKEGVVASAYMGRVKMLPCCACGKPPPSEAHHCRDRPPAAGADVYVRQAAAGRKSSDFDTVPLCPDCHSKFHLDRADFHLQYGRDYGYIAATRKMAGYDNDAHSSTKI